MLGSAELVGQTSWDDWPGPDPVVPPLPPMARTAITPTTTITTNSAAAAIHQPTGDFFCWVVWFMLLFRVFADIFSRHDLGGGGKTLWIIFVIILPFLGVFIYIIANNDGMTERAIARASAQQQQMDDYVRSTAGSGGAAAEIDKAKQLLDSGAITQAEFDALKQKALA